MNGSADNCNDSSILDTNTEPFPYWQCTLGGVAMLLNVITIMAIIRVRSKLQPNIRFVCALIVSDFFIACFHTVDVVLHFVHSRVSSFNPGMCFYVALYGLKQISQMTTLFLLICLAVDLYIAIVLPLRYTKYMSPRHMNWILIVVCVIPPLLGSATLFIPVSCDTPNSAKTDDNNAFCYRLSVCHSTFSGLLTVVLVLLSVIAMSVLYTKIFCLIRGFHSKTPLSMSHGTSWRRHLRGLATTLLILFTFLICYSPTYVSQIQRLVSVKFRGNSSTSDPMNVLEADISNVMLIPILLNSLCDPLLYAVRMRDIRKGYKWIFCVRKWKRLCSPQTMKIRSSNTSSTRLRHPASGGKCGSNWSSRVFWPVRNVTSSSVCTNSSVRSGHSMNHMQPAPTTSNPGSSPTLFTLAQTSHLPPPATSGGAGDESAKVPFVPRVCRPLSHSSSLKNPLLLFRPSVHRSHSLALTQHREEEEEDIFEESPLRGRIRLHTIASGARVNGSLTFTNTLARYASSDLPDMSPSPSRSDSDVTVPLDQLTERNKNMENSFLRT